MRIFKLVLEEIIDDRIYIVEHVIDVPYILSHYRADRGTIIVNALWDMDRELTKKISSEQRRPDDAENKQT